MKTKLCPRCGKTSHSAGARPWICPHCGENMDDVEEVSK
jgi:tRNA(Ile2) C34 agmatinyltransferase TiaS